MIFFNNVCKCYLNGNVGIKDVSFKIDQGDFVFLTGSSGSGKSTIIKLIYKELEPSSGYVYINNTNINAIKKKHVQSLRRQIGVIFQDFKLIKNRTIKQNLAFALEAVNCPRKAIPSRIEEVLALVELLCKQDDYPHQLSGGEQQRAAIARAIINRPAIILADEPTGNLDDSLAINILRVLHEANKRHKTTVLFATHNKFLINHIKTRVLFLKDGIMKEYEG